MQNVGFLMTCGTVFNNQIVDVQILYETSSPKGKDARLRAEKMETSIFQTLKGSLLCGPWPDLAEFQTHTSSYVCYHYL